MIEPSLQLGGGNWANKSDKLLGYHKDGANFYADELTFSRNSLGSYTDANGLIQSMPYNLLEQSNAFSTSPWSKSAGTTLTSGQADPNGGTTAFRMQMSSASNYLASGIYAVTSGAIYTYTIYIKSNTGGNQSFRLLDGVRGASGGVLNGTATTSWQRFELQITTNSTSGAVQLDNAGASYSNDLLICFTQANIGSTALPYFPTTTRLNLARVDYKDNINGSLLLEPQRTNLALYSEQFDNAYWTKLGATITANATTSPDGTQNADKLVEDVGSVQPSFYRTSIANSNATYTKSIYAKAGERIWLVMNIGNGINSARAWFNLSTGVVGTVNAGLTAQIQDADNGWYRCTITREIVAFASSVIEFQIATSDGVEGYTGNGTSGLFIYGCQFEAGSYVSSYIKSEGAATTRLADSCSKTGISDKIGQTEGTLFVDLNFNGEIFGLTNNYYIYIGNGSNTNAIYIDQYNNIFRWVVFDGSTLRFYTDVAMTTGRHKLALAYKNNDYSAYLDGTLITTQTLVSGAVPTCSQFSLIGNVSNFDNNVKQINQALLFPTRLTNAELATLTTL